MGKRFRSFLRSLCRSTFFEWFIYFAISVNTVLLASNHYGIDPEVVKMLDIYNKWFTYLFTVEMLLKLGGYGITKYLRDAMNWLDGFVVIISLFEQVFLELQ